jgi:hypothetical protein
MTRVLFHTPTGDARAVVQTENDFAPSDMTVCLWVRTTDTMGGIISYSAPTVGVEFSLVLTSVAGSV